MELFNAEVLNAETNESQFGYTSLGLFAVVYGNIVVLLTRFHVDRNTSQALPTFVQKTDADI